MTDPRSNTDPLTFVSIGQDPTKPDGWNVVTLSNGEVWKYGGIVERNENSLVVQRIALTDNATGEIGPDGPVLTPDIGVAIEAVGGSVPPIHATVSVRAGSGGDVGNPSASTNAPSGGGPGNPAPGGNGSTITFGAAPHESWIASLESHAATFGRACEADVKALGAKLRKIFEAAKAAL